MKILRMISMSVLCMFSGIAAHAQQEQHGEKHDHSKQVQQHHEQTKATQQHAQVQRKPEREHPRAESTHARHEIQHAQARHTERHAQQQRVEHRQPHRTEAQIRVQRSAWQRHGSQHWESDHRTWQQRGGYRGYRIPDNRFHGYFGPSHGFRINGLPFLVVGGYPRFQYQGYWLSAVDPWPASWGENWYDNDDVYVNYVDNGYYLYNRRYPGVGIAINVSM